MKADIFNHVILKLDIDGEFVAAERVIAFRCPGRAFQLAKVARTFVMVEYDLLIEFV